MQQIIYFAGQNNSHLKDFSLTHLVGYVIKNIFPDGHDFTSATYLPLLRTHFI